MAPERDSVPSRLDRLLDQAVRDGRFLGISYVVTDKTGRTIYAGAHGHRNFGSEQAPMTLDTAGWIASMTKLMTSIATMQIVEKGLIGLDDDVSKVLPELRDQQVLVDFDPEQGIEEYTTPNTPITLRHLLTHTSGFAYDTSHPRLLKWATAKGKPNQFLQRDMSAYSRPLVFHPGTSFAYGPGLDWAGRVIETLTHQTLESYMQTNIWSRVGMKNTTFAPHLRADYPLLDLGRRAAGPYEPLSAMPLPWSGAPIDCLGGGGLFSTVEDYSRLITGLVRENGGLLRGESVEELFRPQLGDAARGSLAALRDRGLVGVEFDGKIRLDHGLGGVVVLDDAEGRRRKGSMHWDGATNPQWMIDRESGIACTLFTQILPCPDKATKELWVELEKVVYNGLEGDKSDVHM